MENRLLLLFSVAFLLWSVAAMAIPYIRRKSDLLTARNFFLLGAAFYVGFSGIKASQEGHYFQYSSKIYLIYYAYIIIFFVTFELAYRKIRWPSRLADRKLTQWPPQEGPGLWFPMALTLAAISLQVVLVQVPGLVALLHRSGMIAPAFAFVFALTVWRRGKMNPVAILAVLMVFMLGAYLSFSIGGGRRFLYALAIAGPVCYYWWSLRYKKPAVVLSMFALVALLSPIGDSAFRAARWVGVKGEQKNLDVGASTRWQIFKDSLFNREESLGQSALQIGQSTAENSLLVAYIFHEARGQFPEIELHPLHTLYVLVTLPIPRVFWDDKPVTLGVSLPYDAGILNQFTGRTNWGPGIAAHAIHDGGVPVAILYAVIIATCLRFIDELLVRHPGNPFLLGYLSSASVQITGLVRGDLSAMAPFAILSFCFMLLILWATRMVIGVETAPGQALRVPGDEMGNYRGFPPGTDFLRHEGAAP